MKIIRNLINTCSTANKWEILIAEFNQWFIHNSIKQWCVEEE